MKRNMKGIHAKYHKQSVRHYVDYDYLDKLTIDQKVYLSQFSDEFYGARFNRKESLHPDEMRREIYGNNNSRNRDIMNVRSASRDYITSEEDE